MISKNEEQVKLEFGNGDICIAGGYINGEDKKTGFVIFTNQEPREVGSVGVIKSGEVDLEEYPIVMTFSKKESIDAVIGQLEQAKSLMD
ncbi:MAG TPA: hypothetical protein VFC79_13505 [Tissierellaceae bacterium]|nr:hypothetical protein [Tissierellaceae bacterium]